MAASLILGVLWSAFHLPFYLLGQMYPALALWPLLLILIGYSVLFTWVFLHSQGSVLLVSLFHAMLNGSTTLTAGIAPTVACPSRGVVLSAVLLR